MPIVPAAQDEVAADVSDRTRRYTLGMLAVVYLFCQLDRQILAILLQPIKADLHFTDTQLGLLTGFAFSLFYATVGLPMALFADRGNRRTLIAGALFVWSLMTALCGFAQNFGQMALTRFGVGIGEAGCNPSAQSILSDLYDRNRRGMALGIYGLGIPAGTLLGMMLGGWISQHYGWRAAFLAAGVPGMLLALLVRLTVPEPRREQIGGKGLSIAPTLSAALSFLRHRPTFLHMSVGGAIITGVGGGIIGFYPAFLIRIHHMNLTEIAAGFGLVAGLSGFVGMFLGGYLADRLGRNDPRWRLWVVSIASLLSCPFNVAAFLVPSGWSSLACLAVPLAFAFFFFQAPSYAQAQNISGVGMRAVTAATLLFVFNFFGQGLGPLIDGAASDALTPYVGDAALGHALAASSILLLWAAWHYYRAGVYLETDLGRSEDY